MSGMSTVWENTGGCEKKYRCALAIYLMTMLSSSYGIIIDRAINAPVHGNNVVDGINATEIFSFLSPCQLFPSSQLS